MDVSQAFRQDTTEYKEPVQISVSVLMAVSENIHAEQRESMVGKIGLEYGRAPKHVVPKNGRARISPSAA